MIRNVTINGITYLEGDYRIRKHGLLFIVEQLYYEYDPIWTEDSRWMSQEKANKHMDLIKQQRNKHINGK